MEFLFELGWNFLTTFGNTGLYLGAALAVLLLLRPLTNRVLQPRHRVALWGGMWLAGFIPQWLEILGWIPYPFGLRQLIVPRTMAYGHLPAYLPRISGEGSYHIALPGGGAIPFSVSEGAAALLGVVGILYVAGVLVAAFGQDSGVKRLTRRGRELSEEEYGRFGLTPGGKVMVKLCADLPTSFVVRHLSYHEVLLQRELPPEQMELVLRHEREHVRQHHPWLQGIAVVAWSFYFWNPVVWIAYRTFRRDMELACDRAVLDTLDSQGRRAYAETLVDLACDRPVWGGLTSFGECDAALRVRDATEWKSQESRWMRGMGPYVLVLALILFLVCGGPEDKLLGADVVTLMEENGVWEQMDRETDWTEDTPFYMKRDGTAYISIRFQNRAGDWCHALFRQRPFRGDLDYSFQIRSDPPDLSDYVVLTGMK